jgi:hypothetical protein
MRKRNKVISCPVRLEKKSLLIFFGLLIVSTLFSQVPIECIKAESAPQIDGVLDDAVWKQARGYSDFRSFSPYFGKPARERTVVYTAYDADNLYFAFECFDREPGKIIGTIKKRDTIGTEDVVGIFIDSHNDGQNAYFLLTNCLGIQQDGIIDSTGANNWSPDFIWESLGVKNGEGYTVEVRVPFKSLRFAIAKVVEMRIGFLRGISRYTEQYAFPEIKDKGSSLEYLGLCRLEGIRNERVFHVLPAVTYLKHRERNEEEIMDSSVEKNLGLTAKIGLTSNMTLDMTVNPDYSHIEIDEGQVDVNLRVDPLFEEKRPFFLEGLEHFKFAATGSGTPIEKIVHTRNIVEPLWGLKLSGKIGKYNVVNSLFSVDHSSQPTALEDLTPGEEGGKRYYGIFRYKRLGKNDSYVGAIYTGKEFEFNTGVGNPRGFNRVLGLDSRVRIRGFVTLDTFFLYSFNKLLDEDAQTSVNNEGSAFGGRFAYEDRKYLLALGYYDLAKNFQLQSGWLLRNGIRMFSLDAERYIYPSSDFLKRLILSYYGKLTHDNYFNMQEYSHEFYADFQLPLETMLTLGYNFSTEVFGGVLFNEDGLMISARSRPHKYLQLTLDYQANGFPFYRDLIQGHLKIFSFSLNFEPGQRFATKFTVTHHNFRQDDGDTHNYNISIFRNKTTFQVNKYLSIRGIVEYDSGKKQILTDSLLEFTYIPGTVFHLGYGSTFQKEYTANDRFFQYRRFEETHSSLFFKASYLFRF